MKPTNEHQELISELDRHRDQVADDLDGLNDSLDFHQRFENSVRRHPGWWLGGALGAGLVLSQLLPFGGNKEEPGDKEKSSLGKRSAFLGLLGITGKEILRISTPIFKEAAADQLDKWLNQRNPAKRAESESSEISNNQSS